MLRRKLAEMEEEAKERDMMSLEDFNVLLVIKENEEITVDCETDSIISVYSEDLCIELPVSEALF